MDHHEGHHVDRGAVGFTLAALLLWLLATLFGRRD
jgi:hypothetical protein